MIQFILSIINFVFQAFLFVIKTIFFVFIWIFKLIFNKINEKIEYDKYLDSKINQKEIDTKEIHSQTNQNPDIEKTKKVHQYYLDVKLEYYLNVDKLSIKSKPVFKKIRNSPLCISDETIFIDNKKIESKYYKMSTKIKSKKIFERRKKFLPVVFIVIIPFVIFLLVFCWPIIFQVV